MHSVSPQNCQDALSETLHLDRHRSWAVFERWVPVSPRLMLSCATATALPEPAWQRPRVVLVLVCGEGNRRSKGGREVLEPTTCHLQGKASAQARDVFG